MSNGTKQMTPEQIKKLFASYLKEQKKRKGNRIKSPGAGLVNKSLAGMNKKSNTMLSQMTSPKPRLAKRGGKMKKKK